MAHSRARSIRYSISSFDFIIVVTQHITQYTVQLYLMFQSPTIDLIATSEASLVIRSLKQIWDGKSVWEELFREASHMASECNVIPTKTRCVSHQTMFDKVSASKPEVCWKRNLSYPLLDHMAEQLEDRLICPNGQIDIQNF